MAKSSVDKGRAAPAKKRTAPPKALARAMRKAAGRTVPDAGADVLDRLWAVVTQRRGTDPATSHSARLLSRGTAKIAQKFGEEAVECLIEAVAGNRDALVAESADVLYHLIVLWVNAGIPPAEIWSELALREGISGIAEKAARPKTMPLAFGVKTTKIP